MLLLWNPPTGVLMVSWLVVLGVLGWLLVWLQMDRAYVPAWQARNGYRVLSVVLLIALVVVGTKAMSWRAELRALIAICR